jgi:hypothetical protein
MNEPKSKPLMRSLGEFVGHIYRAVKADPGKRRTVLNRTSQEIDRGNITLRRTTVDEIEIKPPAKADP